MLYWNDTTFSPPPNYLTDVNILPGDRVCWSRWLVLNPETVYWWLFGSVECGSLVRLLGIGAISIDIRLNPVYRLIPGWQSLPCGCVHHLWSNNGEIYFTRWTGVNKSVTVKLRRMKGCAQTTVVGAGRKELRESFNHLCKQWGFGCVCGNHGLVFWFWFLRLDFAVVFCRFGGPRWSVKGASHQLYTSQVAFIAKSFLPTP